LQTGDHFEYGNNIRDSIIPEGPYELDDTSYYLSKSPPFWDITAAWPSLGIPNDINEFSIPAKERYWFGRTKTVCTDSPYTGVKYPPNINQEIIFWPNPNNGVIHLNTKDIPIDFSLFNLNGSRLLHIKGIKDKIQLPESLPNGIYFIRLSDAEIIRVEKFILNK
jgi:hypothetical protein